MTDDTMPGNTAAAAGGVIAQPGVAGRPYRFAVTAGWIVHLWKSAALQHHRSWAPTIGRFLPEDGIAIDVGAHGGQFTRLLAGLAKHGRVIAVEPSTYARSVLHVALWLRGVRNAAVVATALGAKPGAAVLQTPIKRRGDMGYGLASLSTQAGVSMVTEAVAVTTLDALVAAMNLPRVDFIKADIEGFEASLIAGAVETLRRFRPVLLLEMNAKFLKRAGSGLNELWSDLVALGYRPHAVPAGATVPTPITGAPIDGDVLWIPA
jgi:FkbM family methyltransferase